jgi:hypothetical protein
LRADSQAAKDAIYRILVEDLKMVAAATAKSVRGVARAMGANGSGRKSLFT